MDDNNDDLIDKYLRGEASEEEKSQIHQKPNLEEELALMQNLQIALGKDSRLLIKEQLVLIDEKIVARQWLNKLLVIMGVVFSLVLVAFWLLNSFSTKNIQKEEEKVEQIFAENFEPFPNIIAPIVKGNETISEQEQAYQLYEKGQYDSAFPILEELAKSDTVALFYQAIILLEQNKLEQAKAIFEKIIESNHHTFKEPSEWYLMLTLLKQKEIELAKELIQKINNQPKHSYKAKVEKILVKLVF